MNEAAETGQLTRLESQMQFLIEADRLKQVNRKTSLIGGYRKENSAEHSWQVILMAMTLLEHANREVNLTRVLQMLALHDLGEISGGDVCHYLKGKGVESSEKETVQALFSVLPNDQADKFLKLWDEFTEGSTPEARFAAALDRIWPIVQNYSNRGGSWHEFSITLSKALAKNKQIADGSTTLWGYMQSLMRKADEGGYFAPEVTS